MNAQRKRSSGMTLLEVLLVFAIAAAIFVMSIKQYQNFSRDSNLNQLVTNVDMIAQSAARYYYANCEHGTLDPRSNYYPNMYPPGLYPNAPNGKYPISIATDLITPQYLTRTAIPNPLVDSSGAENGYAVQFNEYVSDRTYCTSADTSGNCLVTPTKIGTIVNWTIQVSVLVKNPTLMSKYMGYLGATCMSSMKKSGSVAPCDNGEYVSYCQTVMNESDPLQKIIDASYYDCVTSSPVYNNYMVWVKSPSYVSNKMQSSLWLTNPTVKQFKQMYEMPSLSVLLNTSHTPEFQYFLCGS